MTSQTREKITIHILPNIQRSKGTQTMKFGQFLEYKMRSIFLEKSYTKCGGETLFQKTKIEHTSRSAVETFIQLVFIVRPT